MKRGTKPYAGPEEREETVGEENGVVLVVEDR